MRLYLKYVKVSMQSILMYPVNLWSKSFGRMLYVYLQICLWISLYSTNAIDTSGNAKIKALSCIILANIIFTVMECNTVNQINDKIRSGEIAMDLLKPMNYMLYTFSVYIGENIINFIFRTLPLTLIITVFWRKYIFTLNFIGGFFVSVILSFFINYLYSYIIGLIAFWLMVTWPLNILLNSIYKFFSGMWIPLFLFPKSLGYISIILPFKYIYTCPINILQAEHIDMVYTELLSQLIWCIGLFLLSILVWKHGKKKLVIQGG